MSKMNVLKMPSQLKISFCTTSMNRLHHIQETLHKNINDNLGYDNLEFVLLNYNSSDDIDNWIRENMMDQIKSRKLIYIKNSQFEFFKRSHAKNIVTRFASGDIVCNVDADNFTGKKFAHYINNQFHYDSNIFLIGGKDGDGNVAGRVCTWKTDFETVRGYDERIVDYGHEDNDLYNRLEKYGRRRVKIKDVQYLDAIKHNIGDRMNNGVYINEIEFGLESTSERGTKAYLLKKSNRFECIEVSNLRADHERPLNERVDFLYGEWTMSKNKIELQVEGKMLLELTTVDEGATYKNGKGESFIRIPKLQASFRYSLLRGEITSEDNLKSSAEVNMDGFGVASVYEVFDV
jgi:hypothetical protein